MSSRGSCPGNPRSDYHTAVYQLCLEISSPWGHSGGFYGLLNQTAWLWPIPLNTTYGARLPGVKFSLPRSFCSVTLGKLLNSLILGVFIISKKKKMPAS